MLTKGFSSMHCPLFNLHLQYLLRHVCTTSLCMIISQPFLHLKEQSRGAEPSCTFQICFMRLGCARQKKVLMIEFLNKGVDEGVKAFQPSVDSNLCCCESVCLLRDLHVQLFVLCRQAGHLCAHSSHRCIAVLLMTAFEARLILPASLPCCLHQGVLLSLLKNEVNWKYPVIPASRTQSSLCHLKQPLS